jgi:multimeric flavodoxin WrbA
MVRVMGVAGSARPKGNSTTLMEAVLGGARAAGAEASAVRLADLEPFRGCRGCLACTRKDACVQRDAVTPVIEQLTAADVWVLASPIYFDGVSGPMKTFFDRLFWLCWNSGRREPRLTGRRSAAVIVTYEDKPRDDYRREAQKLAYYLAWMGEFGEVEIVSEGRLGPPEAARGRPDLLKKAEELGGRLVDAVRE